MAKKKMTKSAKRRLTVLMPIVILAVGYFGFTVVRTATQLYQLHREEATLKEQLNDLKGDSKELKAEITKLQDKEYVARFAREEYSYTKDGEYVIKTKEKKDTKKDNSDFEINPDYVMYGSIGTGVFIVLYVIIKSVKNKKANKKKRVR